MPTPYLTQTDATAFTDRVGSALKAHLTEAFATGGADALIAECKKWGVSDLHLEVLQGWPRCAVRQFKSEHPEMDWAGFVWDQL